MTKAGKDSYVHLSAKDLTGLLSALLRGEKPVLDPADSLQSSLITLLDILHDEHDLAAGPTKHYTLPEKSAPTAFTGLHPMDVALHEEALAYKERLISAKAIDTHILGSELTLRNAEHSAKHQGGKTVHVAEAATHFILGARADLWSYADALQLINSEDEGMAYKIIHVLDTPRNKTFFAALGIDTDVELANGLNIQFAPSIENLLQHVSYTEDSENRPVAKPVPPMLSLNNATAASIYYGTGNMEKKRDVQQLVTGQGYLLNIRDGQSLVGDFPISPEQTGTFAGNANDKLQQLMAEYASLASQPNGGNILPKQLPHPVIIMTTDEGAIFDDQSIFENAAFDSVRDEISPDRDAPGPEMKPLISKMGGDRLAMINQLRALGYTGKFGAVDMSVATIGVIQEDGTTQSYAVKATHKFVYDLDLPMPDVEFPVEQHFKIPEGSELTQEELLDRKDPRAQTLSANGKAVLGLFTALNISKAPHNVQTLTAGVPTKNLTLAIDPHLPPSLTKAFTNVANLRQYRLGHAPVTLADVREIIQDADGFVFSGMEPKGSPTTSSDLYLSLLLQSSLFVGKQLKDPSVNGSPIMYANAEARTDTKAFFDLLSHASRCGLVGERTDLVVTRCEALVDCFKQAHDLYRENDYPIVNYDDTNKMLPETDMDNITLFLSFSATEDVHMNNAADLTYNAHANGFGVITGGANANTMGASPYASCEFRHHNPDVPFFVGAIQDPHAVKREGSPQEFMDDIVGEGHFITAPDIFERMRHLAEMDRLMALPRGERQKAFVVQPGGAGTVQEIMAVLWLKSIGHEAFEQTTVILQNPVVDKTCGARIKPWDKLIALLGSDMQKLGVVEVETTEEALREAANAVGRDPASINYSYHPHLAGTTPFDANMNRFIRRDLGDKFGRQRDQVLGNKLCRA